MGEESPVDHGDQPQRSKAKPNATARSMFHRPGTVHRACTSGCTSQISAFTHAAPARPSMSSGATTYRTPSVLALGGRYPFPCPQLDLIRGGRDARMSAPRGRRFGKVTGPVARSTFQSARYGPRTARTSRRLVVLHKRQVPRKDRSPVGGGPNRRRGSTRTPPLAAPRNWRDSAPWMSSRARASSRHCQSERRTLADAVYGV